MFETTARYVGGRSRGVAPGTTTGPAAAP